MHVLITMFNSSPKTIDEGDNTSSPRSTDYSAKEIVAKLLEWLWWKRPKKPELYQDDASVIITQKIESNEWGDIFTQSTIKSIFKTPRFSTPNRECRALFETIINEADKAKLFQFSISGLPKDEMDPIFAEFMKLKLIPSCEGKSRVQFWRTKRSIVTLLELST